MKNLKRMGSTEHNVLKNTKAEDILKNIDVSTMFETRKLFQPYRLFYQISGLLPSKIAYSGIDKEKLFSTILQRFPYTKNLAIKSEDWNYNKQSVFFRCCVIPIEKELFINYCPYTGDVELLYSNNINMKKLENIKKIIIDHREEPEKQSGNIFLLCSPPGGSFELMKFKLYPYNVDIEKYYNNDFHNIHEILCKRLSIPNEKGIVLLHGKPGTGKTSYIRQLNTFINKRMIYIQSEISDRMASPEFISFIMDYPNSILIVEDAENVLRERSGFNGNAVTNILNISDGLLSDCLNLQLVCSFNTDLSRIDKALLRKGRIIASYEFKELEVDKARNLANNLGKKLSINKPMTLAEIFNSDSLEFGKKEENKIGFAYA